MTRIPLPATTGNQTIDLPGVGPVLLAPSQRAKRLVLSIRPFKGVRLAIPTGVSPEQATAFLRSKQPWLANHLPRIRKLEAELAARANQLPIIDRRAATRKLHHRLRELARRHAFSYNRVTFRNQRTRWGSCSGANNISLNIKLAALPEALCDYVLLHELLHTRIKNHGPAFWAALDLLVGNAQAKRSALRAYSLTPP